MDLMITENEMDHHMTPLVATHIIIIIYNEKMSKIKDISRRKNEKRVFFFPMDAEL